MIRIKHNKAAYAMIKAAVEKGLQDMREDPARSIRNLVELGSMFAGGPLQKDFFAIAQQELAQEDSSYGRLVEQVVKNADPAFLTTFGVNLGYNCWSYGAKFIRTTEAQYGFNIPWTLFLEMDAEQEMTLELLDTILQQGSDLGIYCYMFRFTRPYSQMDALMQKLSQYAGCAFVLLMEPGLIDDNVAQQAAEMKNILMVFNLESDEVEERRAVEVLSRNGNMFGGFVRYDTLDSADDRLAEAREKGLPLLAFLQGYGKSRADMVRDRAELVRLRTRLEHSVFPIDLFGDIAYLDRNISSEACVVIIHGDGSMVIRNYDTETTVQDQNIGERPLVDIFRHALPK